MNFLITRTNDFTNSKPCEEAYEDIYISHDIRTLHSFEDFDEKFKNKFEDNGRNHHINDEGYIQREFVKEGWFVSLNSLEELIHFKEKYGSLVIGNHFNNKNITEIEIYDGYRE